MIKNFRIANGKKNEIDKIYYRKILMTVKRQVFAKI